MAKEKISKVVLAYSGGLDTSVIIPWLKENYGCEVIAVCADVGQGDELNAVHDKALRSGASKVFIEDLTKDFIENYIFPTLKAGAVYEEKYLLGTSFARPIIAKNSSKLRRLKVRRRLLTARRVKATIKFGLNSPSKLLPPN